MQQSFKYVMYLRKSTEGKEKQVQSIERQLKELQQFAERENLNIVKIMEPEEKSAKAPYKRTVFYDMIKLIESGEANAILTWHMDRLSRNPTDSGTISQLMDDGKLLVIQTPYTKHESNMNLIMIDIEASIAKNFIRDLRIKVNSGMALKMSNGGIPGPAPQGYKNNYHLKTIEIDEDRFETIKSIFHMYLKGMTVPEIKKYLDEIGYLTPVRKSWGGIPISRTGVYSILTNIRYAGIIPNPYNPDDNGVAQFPSMITIQQFDQIQHLLGTRGRPKNISAKVHLPYRGLIHCGECGCMITPTEKFKKLKNGSTKTYIYYRCTMKRKCTQKRNIEFNVLQRQISEIFNSYALDEKLYEWGLKALDEIADQELKNRSDTTKFKFEKVESLEKQLSKLVMMNANNKISDEMFEQLSKPLETEINRRKSELHSHEDTKKNWYELVGQSLSNMKVDILKNNQVDEHDRVLRAVGEKPILMDGKVILEPFDWLKPILKQLNTLMR